MPSRGPLDLKGICRNSAMRLHVDGVEVWRGLTFLGTVSGEWLAAQIQDRLDTIEISEWLRSELAADPTRRLGPLTEEMRPMLRKPLAFMPITRDVKAKRRDARRKSKGKRGAS